MNINMLPRVPTRSLLRVRPRPGRTVAFSRSLSSRAGSVLGALDLPIRDGAELPGVYDGSWRGKGDVFESVCPSTGEVLARIRSVSAQ